jgi:plasmid replication initiation protein
MCYGGWMGQKVEGGIRVNQGLQRFAAFASDIAIKDQIDLMSRCWFSLTAKRTEPIEHQYVDAKTNRMETVRITGSPEYGIATIHDQDLIIFVISQWVEAKRLGLEPTRRICFTPYQFFAWINRTPSGGAYQRLKDALHRLRTTNVETTFSFDKGQRRSKQKQFSWISEWETQFDEDGNIRGVEVVLAEWLFESIQDFHVLTLDKRYFEISSSIERWLYLYARKATGGASGVWKETFKNLHKKSASQQEYKHYASELRKIIRKNELPGLQLSQRPSVAGLDMLCMERTEKREVTERKNDEQLVLIEKNPAEEMWETTLEILEKRLGASTVKAWIAPLEFQGFEDGVLALRSPNKFIADWVESRFQPQIVEAWESFGNEVKVVRLEPSAAKVA